ncbi:MAG: hypothetical protein ACREA0_13500 [bacterium]
MSPITVRGAGVERKGDRLLAVFTLSETPGQPWIQFFTERSAVSLLNLAAATFRRNRLYVDLPGHSDLETLMRSVEAIIEGSNFDVEFRSAEHQ